MGGNYYRVIGVMEPRSQAAKDEKTADSAKGPTGRVFIPLETAWLRYGDLLMRRRTGSF